MVQSVEQLVFVQIPQERLAVLATGSAKGAIRRNSYSVQVTRVSGVANTQFAIGQIPDLDSAIPTGRDDDWVGVVWRESHTGYPVGVTIFLDGVLALSQSVPQLDGLVARAGDDLTVVNGEGDRKNVL